MKNGEVLKMYETLNRIGNNPDLKFSIALGYTMAKNKEKLRQEAAIIYQMRQDIILEHGKLDGKNIIVPNEYIDEVNRKIDELMEIENDVQIMQVPVELFDTLELNMEDIEGLSGMIQPFGFTGPPRYEEKQEQ